MPSTNRHLCTMHIAKYRCMKRRPSQPGGAGKMTCLLAHQSPGAVRDIVSAHPRRDRSLDLQTTPGGFHLSVKSGLRCFPGGQLAAGFDSARKRVRPANQSTGCIPSQPLRVDTVTKAITGPCLFSALPTRVRRLRLVFLSLQTIPLGRVSWSAWRWQSPFVAFVASYASSPSSDSLDPIRQQHPG
jgi:hypothetical protein